MKKLDKALFIFIIIQPFLDFYLLFSEEVTSIFKFSPSTIIRIIFCAIFLVYTLFKKDKSKKEWIIFCYLILVFIYLLFHIYNSLQFNTTILNTMNFSYVTEAFYFFRLLLPLCIAYITYKSSISEDTFMNSIIIVSLIFSLEIIIANILKLSLMSYGNGTISGNIFDWFLNNKFTFEQLASKGFFYMANQISAVLMLLLPINIYYALRFSKSKAYISSITLVISMIMLGTRVATYGWIIVAICLFISWIVFSKIYKTKGMLTRKNLIIYIFSFLILLYITYNSPLVLRKKFTDYATIENNMQGRTEILESFTSLNTKEEKEDFINEYCQYFSIPKEYVSELYPYDNDTEFWIEVMKLPYSVRGGNRNLEKLITKRIYELNNNKYDKYFGMGYSRYRNAKIYIESDFTVHFYTIGIFGIIIFLIPYILIATYPIVYMLVKHRFRLKIFVLCISIYICIGISYFSGHVLDEFIVTIILGYICGYLLYFVKHNKEKCIMYKSEDWKKKKKKLSIIIPVYNAEKYISKCLDSLINQSLNGIEIIAVDDGSTDGTSRILDEYAKNYKNIKVKHIKNGGVANARNIGLELAECEYIGFIDSDDYVDSTMYEKLYFKAKSYNLDIVACDATMKYPDKDRIISSGIYSNIIENENLKKQVLIYSYHVIWNKIYKKSLLKNIKFKDKSNFCEDVEFLYKVIPLANRIGSVDESLYNYIQHEGSLTYVYDKKLYQLIENFDGLVELYKHVKKYKKYLDEIEYSYVRYLYATFIKRLAKTKNKEEFFKGVDIVISKVNTTFPNYKKNKYIRKFNLKNIYLKNFNKRIANIIFKLEKNKMN